MNPRTRLAALLSLPALVIPFASHPAWSQGSEAADQQQYQGENPDRYAMVRALDGDVRITKGDVQDTLLKGTPVGEGDVVESRGRGVLQLADGTRVAFSRNTKFTVASLFKNQDGYRQVLLRLDRGRLRVKMDDDSDAKLRIDTPSATVSISNRATFDVDVDSDGVARISVNSGHVRVSNQRDDASLGAGEQLSVFGSQDRLNRIRAFNTYDQDDFDRWSDGAWKVSRGESWDRVPAELRYYSDDLDDHGSWVYSDEYGWVWKPGGVAADWRPYYDGRWAAYPGGMTWVSNDPWGYVTYHHGRWAWSVGGWFWIPGLYYSPAWVAWSYNDGYCGWAPLGYYNTPCTWGYGAWGGGYCWNVVSINYINVYNVNRYCAYNRTVITNFNRGIGATTWAPNRGLTAPWRTRPLMATPAEFRNPSAGQFHRAFQPAVERERFASYQQRAAAMGRQVYFRPTNPNSGVVPPNRGAGGPAQGGRVPFEDRGALNRGDAGRGVQAGSQDPRSRGFQPRPRNTDDTPGRTTQPDRGNQGGRPDQPRTRDFQPRPRSDQDGNPGRGSVPDRTQPRDNPRRDFQSDRGNFDRRPTPDRTPDRSFDRDFDRPAPRREAPPMRDFPAPRNESRPNESRPSAPPRQERPAAPSRGSEAPRGNSGGGERRPFRR